MNNPYCHRERTRRPVFISYIVVSFAALFFFFTAIVVPTASAEEKKTYQAPALSVNIPTVSMSDVIVDATGYLDVNFLGQYISGLYKYLLGFATLVAIVFVMIGGVRYVLAAGSQGQVGEAKKQITNAVTGLVLLLFVYIILYTVNPQLTFFRPLMILSVPEVLFEMDIASNLRDCPDVKGKVKPCSATRLSNSGLDSRLQDLINQVAAAEDVDAFLIATHIKIETNGNINYGRNTGPCGEIGPTQFMPTTFEAVVGRTDCCIGYAAKSLSDVKKAACDNNFTTAWPPPTSYMAADHCRLDFGCASCQIASPSCIDYFDTAKPDGLKNVITATTKYIKSVLVRVQDDRASEMCAYNGSGRHAAEYAAKAATIYSTFCSNAGGSQ